MSENKKNKDLTTPEQEYDLLLESIGETGASFNLEVIEKAYKFASHAHRKQMRKSGEMYITHPLAVARIACSLKLDQASIVAAILHDTVEDTEATLACIEKEFGEEVMNIVDGLTKISKIKFRSSQEKLAENFRKMILAMAKDLRVILIKLCDRLHNMRTISSMADHKKKRISQETLDIYAPLANRLGIYNLKSELEDICLRHIKPEIYQEIRTKVAAKKSVREKYINEVLEILETELMKYGFQEVVVYGRPKHFFSIYKKMVDRHLDFEDIYDLFAFRIIVDNIRDCYEALGVVHAMWKPMPGRFKDYIAMPKANLYQSLHTTVIRPNGEPCEIQIRTKEMHDTCEFGVAAHWDYKESNGASSATDMEKFSWLRQIVEWQQELKDPDEFLEAVKVDLFDEEIFVFTPKGDVFSLPYGASALDFAFTVHTQVGLKCMGAKLNGRMVPIKKKLKSGDIVEILTSPHQKPSKDWLSYVTTSKARNKIRSHLRSEQRDKSRKLGKELLDQALEKLNIDPNLLSKQKDQDKFVKAARENSFEDVLIGIGYGRYNPESILERAFPPEKENKSLQDEIDSSEIEVSKKTSSSKKDKSSVLVSGYDDVLVQMAKCCSPLPGEPIVGFITRGRGVTIHRTSCPRALDMDPARKIQVEWSDAGENSGNYHKCHLVIKTKDKPGVLAEVTQVLSNFSVNVHKAEAKVSADLTGILDFELGVKNLNHLELVLAKLEAIPSVVSVSRKNLVKQRRFRRGRLK